MEFVVLMIVTSLAGGAIWQSIRIAQLRATMDVDNQIERDILRAAMQCGGRITALDVRSTIRYSVAQVERRLRELHSAGYCESHITPDGTHYYIFSAYDDTPMRAQVIEKTILQIANRCDGAIRISQVAMETDLTFAEAKAWIEAMAAGGICCETEEPGVYRFFPSRATAKHGRGLESAKIVEHSAPLELPAPPANPAARPLDVHPAAIPIYDDDDYEFDEATGLMRLRRRDD